MLKPASLESLPPELLDRTVSHFEEALSLVCLARTSKYLYDYGKKHGFRVYLQHTFPHATTPPAWADATRGLTTLAKAWEQKALTAVVLRPPVQPDRAGTGQARPHDRSAGRPSIEFQPVLDCYEEWPGGSWRARREILACGAGPRLVVRVRHGGARPYDSVDEADVHDDPARWMTWAEGGYREGPDDITAVQLLRPHQRGAPDDGSVELVASRWSGELRHLRISQDGATTVARFDAGGQAIRCADLSIASSPLLACAAEAAVHLFSIADADPASANPPVDTLTAPAPERANRVWAPRFLSARRLAVGRGPSATPLAVHDVSPTGVRPEPIFAAPATTAAGRDAAYAVTALPRPHADGLVLAGMHSGALLLHDLRAPPAAGPAARYDDPVDPLAPIYTILPAGGPDRVLAGAGRHGAVKVFDLRRTPRRDGGGGGDRAAARDFTLFLPNPRPQQRGRGGGRNGLESPVYALAGASAGAPTWYAGVQGAVVQVDVSAWAGAPPGRARGRTAPQTLGLLEHPADPSGSMQLRGQTYELGQGASTSSTTIEGWDPRWRQYVRDPQQPRPPPPDQEQCRNQ